MNDAHRGAKIGPRIANLVSQSMIVTHRKMLDMKHKLAVMIFNTVTNEISDEVDLTIGPILKQLATAHEKDGPAAAYLEFMRHGRGQLKAIAGSSAVGQSLTWAIGTILSNFFAPDVYKAVGFTPNMIPDPASLAEMAATGEISVGKAVSGIGANGFAEGYANAWIAAARTYPGLPDLLQLLNRGAINEGQFTELAQKAGMPPNISGIYYALRRSFVSMEDAAVAFLRGAIDRSELEALGEIAGFQSHDVDVYLEAIGEPPATMELLEAYRRGFIDRPTLEKGIRQGRTRNEWIPVIEQLRFSPMSIADAVNAVVQNHISQDAGQAIAEQNGLEASAFPTLVETAGSPLSRTEMEQLYNRGLVTQADVEQALRESRLKNKYVEHAFQLHTRLLEPRSLGEAVRHGALTHDEAIRKAMESGYTAADAAILVESASGAKLATSKDRVVSSAEALFMDSAISESDFRNIMASMGHTGEEADFVVQASVYHREAKAVTAALGAVRSKFIGHHIERGEASSMLDGLGIPATQRDCLIGYWSIELAANTRNLTPAQILKAVALGLITADEGQAKLEFLGYSAEDAALLMAGA